MEAMDHEEVKSAVVVQYLEGILNCSTIIKITLSRDSFDAVFDMIPLSPTSTAVQRDPTLRVCLSLCLSAHWALLPRDNQTRNARLIGRIRSQEVAVRVSQRSELYFAHPELDPQPLPPSRHTALHGQLPRLSRADVV